MTLMKQLDGMLWHAATDGDMKRAREALESGADVNAIGGCETALHRAVSGGHLEMCCLLIEAGADAKIFTPGKFGSAPLHCAFSSLRPSQVEIILLLLENGADPNQPDAQRGLSSLHLAAAHCMDEASIVIRTLVRFGADPNLSSDAGMTPLRAAGGGDRPWSLGTVRQLVECGADPAHRPPKAPLTAFQAAVRAGHGRLAEYYVRECGQDIEQVTEDGQTLLELVEGRPHALRELQSLRAALCVVNAISVTGAEPLAGRQRQQLAL